MGAGRGLPQQIAVVREAFAAHDAPHGSLSSFLHALGPHKVAVASQLTEPHNRLVVDEYEITSDGKYHLRSIGVDMHRCAGRREEGSFMFVWVGSGWSREGRLVGGAGALLWWTRRR